MTPGFSLRDLLAQVARGDLGVDDALASLAEARTGAVSDFARIDHDRAQRCGTPEVVFCQGKQPADAVAIAAEILQRAPRVLLTRVEDAHWRALAQRWPDARHDPRARCAIIGPPPRASGLVAVLAAGTADLPVAAEATVTATALGAEVRTFHDVGVAGLHRLLEPLEEIRRARAIVAVAGMEGALPSVVAGLVRVPVIAVPTSVGYGASYGGLAALLAMLNACAAGVAVVNIDNGFGAGYLAAQINRQTRAEARREDRS